MSLSAEAARLELAFHSFGDYRTGRYTTPLLFERRLETTTDSGTADVSFREIRVVENTAFTIVITEVSLHTVPLFLLLSLKRLLTARHIF